MSDLNEQPKDARRPSVQPVGSAKACADEIAAEYTHTKYTDGIAEIIERHFAKMMSFVKDISEQRPEKPDYWSSCSQCDRNIDNARDLLRDVCHECGGTGGVHSGGVTPWGSAITLPCPSCSPNNQAHP